MPVMYMLIGVPGSGKSTWRENVAGTVISTDDLIDQRAKTLGSTYDAVFSGYIPTATKMTDEMVLDAVAAEADIIWDQTNVSVKQRRRKLNNIPVHYRKIAVYFPTPESAEHSRRLQRPGKTIPRYVIESMLDQLEIPTLSEGFDEITVAT